jgi:hypothetical protein
MKNTTNQHPTQYKLRTLELRNQHYEILNDRLKFYIYNPFTIRE